MTAAMYASKFGEVGCLQLLIAARVDLEAKDTVSKYVQVRLLVNASGGVDVRGGRCLSCF